MEPHEYNKPFKHLLISAYGYFFFTDKDHPLAYKSNHRVYLHRHNASLKLGRWIRSDEHVHHIDKNRQNNALDNLLILNNVEHANLHGQEYLKERKCKNCGETFFKKAREASKIFCSTECSDSNKRKTNWPTKEQMAKLVWEIPTQKIAKQLGISDVAVAKFCKKHGISKPPRGYWAKYQSNKL